jgi:hypothetical protein
MNCPNCKNPLQQNASECEWCGFEREYPNKFLNNNPKREAKIK